MQKTKTIVVTGFEPFGGLSYNPSEQIARQLDGYAISGFIVKSFVLPVDTGTAPAYLTELLADYKPEALISLGLAAGRAELSLERVAINLKDWETQDNAGNIKTDEPIDPAGPTAYLATLPLRQIKDALDGADIPVKISNTAGLYLCNQIMYWGLHLAARQSLARPSGFIHLPCTPDMPGLAENTPVLPLTLQQQGIELALQTIVLELQK